MKKSTILNKLDELKIDHPNNDALSNNLEAMIHKSNENFILIDKDYNPDLLNLVFDWSYYPFIDKSLTFNDIYTKNFFNLNNKDFFVFDENNQKDGVFVSSLWMCSVMTYLKSLKIRDEDLWEDDVSRLYDKNDMKKVIARITVFIKNFTDKINELLDFAKNTYKILSTLVLKDFQYHKKITDLSSFIFSPIELYKKSCNEYKAYYPRDLYDMFFKYDSKNAMFFCKDTLFSFRDLYDENSNVYKIKDEIINTLKSFDKDSLLKFKRNYDDYGLNFILFMKFFSKDFYNRIKNDLIDNLSNLFNVFISSLKSLKHTAFVLNETINNSLADSIYNLNDKNTFVPYKNALKFYNIIDLINNYKNNNKSIKAPKNANIFINPNDTLLKIDGNILQDSFLNQALQDYLTNQKSVFSLKNLLNPTDTLNTSKYDLPVIYSKNEIWDIHNTALSFLKQQKKRNSNDSKYYKYNRLNDDAILNNFNWIQTALMYDLSNNNEKTSVLNQIKKVGISYQIIDQKGFYDQDDEIKKCIEDSFVDGNENKKYLRKLQLVQFFSTNDYLNYPLYFGSIKYNAFKFEDIFNPKPQMAFHYASSIHNVLKTNPPLLKVINLSNEEDVKQVKQIFTYYNSLSKLIIANILNQKAIFWQARFNENQLNETNKYKENNTYENEIKNASVKLLENLNNGKAVITNENNTNKKTIRR